MLKVVEKARAWGSRPGSIGILFLGLILGVAFFGSAASFMVYANSEKFFATSCHEMGELAIEHKGTIHDTNRTGVRATCNDCHVPHGYIPNYLAKFSLWRDYWGHFVTHSIGTKEKFEAKRYELAKKVWLYMKSNDSRECRYCHTTTKMDPDRQTEVAKKRHALMRTENITCVDCHYAIAHTEPDGPGPMELNGPAPTPAPVVAPASAPAEVASAAKS
ncbi:denitrification system component NirT [mine drainage metagenome]|uniref:Denitrification system component NirT n=1 Tax=mine drainage metagenome TaxID=410659 RepID=A0A1J5PVE0_9ZZZZ